MIIADAASIILKWSGCWPASIGIVAFWLVLPFIITPIMRNRILPPWDEVKKELEPKGYNRTRLLARQLVDEKRERKKAKR